MLFAVTTMSNTPKKNKFCTVITLAEINHYFYSCVFEKRNYIVLVRVCVCVCVCVCLCIITQKVINLGK